MLPLSAENTVTEITKSEIISEYNIWNLFRLLARKELEFILRVRGK